MSALRDARAAVLRRHWRRLTDGLEAALPAFLDDLDAVDREHDYEPGSLVLPSGEREIAEIIVPPAPATPAPRRRPARKDA